MLVHDFDGGTGHNMACDREVAGIAPFFECRTSVGRGDDKFLVFQGHKVSVNENDDLTIDDSEVLFPDNKIGEKVQKLEDINLSFTTDKAPLRFAGVYNPQRNQSYKVKTDNYAGLATEVIGTKPAEDGSCYDDDTPVKMGDTEHYALTPIKAKWVDNGIQVTEVITAIQLEEADIVRNLRGDFQERDVSTYKQVE